MSRRIVIAGAGGFGRGVYAWITSSPRHLSQHGIDDVVFVDDGPNEPSEGLTVVSTISDYRPLPGDEVLCSVAAPAVRHRIVERLEGLGATFHTFVDDRVTLAHDVTVGEGSIICPGVVISAGAQVGSQVHINFNCSIGHDVVVGDFSTLSPAVNVMGEVIVQQGAFFGGSSTILPRLAIGRGAIIGAGAVVIRGAEHKGTYVGSPARLAQGKMMDDQGR